MTEPVDQLKAAHGSVCGTCNLVPWWLQRICHRLPALAARYLALDPRSLGLTRIYLGALLLADLARRTPDLSVWYTNRGLLPNHMLLWQPTSKYQFSLFFLASHEAEAIALFVVCGTVFALLLVGYRTRLFHVLAFVCICSLHNRLSFFEDGSEVTTRLLTFWTIFLPLGARFSLDALRAPRADPKQPQGEVVAGPERRPAVSLAVLAILLQLAAIYLFNALHKQGETWRTGSVVHYVLHQDRMVTWFGLQLRPHIDLAWSRALTWSALAMEAVLPALILSPLGTTWTRRAALLIAVGLHCGFAALLNLGMFSFNMIGFFLLLLSARDWDVLARVGKHAVARVRRLLLGLRTGLEALFTSRQRGHSAAASPLRIWVRARAVDAREATVALFMLALGCQMLLENAVPAPLKVEHRPKLLRLLVEYPRLYEGWSMFAPDAPTTDAFLYVDALTAGGRRVDPFNERASRIARLPVDQIPAFLDQDDSFCDYSLNILGVEAYQAALHEWILDYPRRTGRKTDQIREFVVWVIEDESPPPGETRPRNVTKRRLLSGGAPY